MSLTKIIITTVFLSTILFTTISASANTSSVDKIKEKLATFSTAKCEDKKASLIKKTTDFATTKKIKQTELLTKITETVTKLKTKGKDTTKLDKDLVTLKSEIDSANVANSAVVTSVTSISCVDKATNKSGLSSVKIAQGTAREKSKTIRDFVKNIIRQDIKALK